VARELKGVWALAALRGLRTGSPPAESLLRSLASDDPARIHVERQACSSIPLPGDYETYLASLARKFGTPVRYRANHLPQTCGGRLLRTARTGEGDPPLERFFEMHQGRWVEEGRSGSFYHPRKRAFYREVAESFLRRGWLRFYHLEVDGITRASQ